jgi:hypothetical protein
VERVRQLIREQKMLLLVGAGVSMRVGYPSFDGYARELVQHFDVKVDHLPQEDASAIAGFVKTTLDEAGRVADFYAHLERTFGPARRREYYDQVHQVLVRAGFRGIVTTNYDSLLEDAASDDGPRCEDLDLCARRSFAVFDFLRATSGGRSRAFVLHLHGWFRSPQHLILTSDDYAKRYGPYFQHTDEGVQVRVDLDTMHRKVMWALFVSYPVLFVGFSLRDPALRHFLDLINNDFERGRDLDHFAVMGAADEAQEQHTAAELGQYGVTPIFYPVTRDPGLGADASHRALENVLVDLCGEPLGPPSRRRGEDFTARMLA